MTLSSEFTEIPKSPEIKEDRLRFATKAAQIGIWEFDYEKKTLWRTETHDLLYGFEKMQPEWNYECFLKILHPDDKARVTQILSQEVQTDDQWSMQYRIIWPDKSIHWIESKAQIERDITGKATKVVGAITDITEIKRIEEERSNFAAMANLDLDNLKSEREMREKFVSTLTHDLRNPLTAIKMSAQILLLNLNNPENSGKAALRIIDAVERADRMIKDLLDANRIRAKQKLPIQVNRCCLTDLLENTIEELIIIHGNRFILKCPESVEGYWDYDGIRRVVENLSNNAVKYGAEQMPITISVKQDPQTVELSVHNHGGELSPKEQAMLFEHYRRTNAALASQQKGWGIGLTLVRGIIEAHGGSIKVDSYPGRGTRFIAELPNDSRQFNTEITH